MSVACPADMARIMHVGLDGTHVAWPLEWHDTCIPSKLAWTLHAPSRPVTWHDCCLAEGQPRPDTMLVVYSTNTPTQPMTRGHGLMPAELNASHSQAGWGANLRTRHDPQTKVRMVANLRDSVPTLPMWYCDHTEVFANYSMSCLTSSRV